jgi:hypothetical protein
MCDVTKKNIDSRDENNIPATKDNLGRYIKKTKTIQPNFSKQDLSNNQIHNKKY